MGCPLGYVKIRKKLSARSSAFAAAGGTLLFGTDVGYRLEYDTTPEHALLARAGLSFAARLAMLTTAPAARFHVAHSGRLAAGLDAAAELLDRHARGLRERLVKRDALAAAHPFAGFIEQLRRRFGPVTERLVFQTTDLGDGIGQR